MRKHPGALMLERSTSLNNTYRRINYRKIYEKHYGPIPKEPDGRSYEIHHKDGNHTNNNPLNLIAVTLEEHYNLHYAQGDYGACYMMATQRMNKSPEEISDIISKHQRQLVAEGRHHLLGGKIQRQLVKDGTHHLLSGEIQRKSSLKRGKEGTLPGQGPSNPFWGGAIQKRAAEQGLLSTQIAVCCIKCKQETNVSNLGRRHTGDCADNTVIINGIEYASKFAAAKALNTTLYSIIKRLK